MLRVMTWVFAGLGSLGLFDWAVAGIIAMPGTKPVKRGKDTTSTKRAGAHLDRLAEGGGAPVRVDTQGPDLKLLDGLVASGYAPSRTEAYREAHARQQKKIDAV